MIGVVVNVFFEGADSAQSVHYINVACGGNENRLSECSPQDAGNTCEHDRDVGVICTVTQRMSLIAKYLNLINRGEYSWSKFWWFSWFIYKDQ